MCFQGLWRIGEEGSETQARDEESGQQNVERNDWRPPRSLHSDIFNNKHLLGKVSAALGQGDVGFGDFRCVDPHTGSRDGDPQNPHGFRLLCNLAFCFIFVVPLETTHIPSGGASCQLRAGQLLTPLPALFLWLWCFPHHSHLFPLLSQPHLPPHGHTRLHHQLYHFGCQAAMQLLPPLQERVREILVFSGQDRRTYGCQTQEPAVLVICICSRVLYDVKISFLP